MFFFGLPRSTTYFWSGTDVPLPPSYVEPPAAVPPPMWTTKSEMAKHFDTTYEQNGFQWTLTSTPALTLHDDSGVGNGVPIVTEHWTGVPVPPEGPRVVPNPDKNKKARYN